MLWKYEIISTRYSICELINTQYIVKTGEVMKILEKGHKGCVTSFWNNRGYGFIRDDSLEQDIFFHMDAVKSCEVVPFIGECCRYDIGESPRGYKAVNVQFGTEPDEKPGRVVAVSE